MKKFVSVIIPAHNEQKYISACINSLLKQDYGQNNFEIIVIDNNSTDKTRKIVMDYPSVKYYFKLDGPVGAVRNYGVKNSKGDILVFIDSDCVAPPYWIRSGVLILMNGEADVIGGKCELPESSSWLEKFWLLGVREKLSAKLDLIGASIFVRKTHFESVGGFNEIITSGEDTKLAQDLRNVGLKVEIKQKLNVQHLANAKSIRAFLLRQAWHSENYISNLADSMKDPTFLLILAFLLTTSVNIFFIIAGNFTGFIASTIVFFVLPSILTAKRIHRARNKPRFIFYPVVYFIDLLYIFGRIIGIIRGLKNKITIF